MEFSSAVFQAIETVKCAFTNCEAFRFITNAIVIDGKIVEFAAGERAANGMAVIFFEKGDISCKGLYPVPNNLFVKENFSDLSYANMQEDRNIGGLLHNKTSYGPVFTLKRYTAGVPC